MSTWVQKMKHTYQAIGLEEVGDHIVAGAVKCLSSVLRMSIRQFRLHFVAEDWAMCVSVPQQCIGSDGLTDQGYRLRHAVSCCQIG